MPIHPQCALNAIGQASAKTWKEQMMSEALRKAAEQALVALKNTEEYLRIEVSEAYGRDAHISTIHKWEQLLEYHQTTMDSLRAALAEPEQSEPKCNPHPKAPHGFDRNGSHSAGRYVCDCEHWEPYDAGYRQGFQDGQKFEEEMSWPECDECAAPPRREPLTDEEVGRLTVFEGLHHAEVPLLAQFVRHIEKAIIGVKP
jgi:hypothetical protein